MFIFLSLYWVPATSYRSKIKQIFRRGDDPDLVIFYLPDPVPFFYLGLRSDLVPGFFSGVMKICLFT